VVVNLTYYIVWIIQNSQNDVIFSERTTFVDYLVDKVIIHLGSLSEIKIMALFIPFGFYERRIYFILY
jgi:bacteriorhodopsin